VWDRDASKTRREDLARIIRGGSADPRKHLI
jgi:hypothetical protein